MVKRCDKTGMVKHYDSQGQLNGGTDSGGGSVNAGTITGT